ncbi:MAG: glutamine amidotransferase family protein [Anaerofustis sp.]
MKREGEIRIPSGCAISGIFSKEKRNIRGDIIVKSMEVMHDRSNGLGGGFAGYGIYPKYKELYAFHMFYDTEAARADCEKYLENFFEIKIYEEIPTSEQYDIADKPLIWRYFILPLYNKLQDSGVDEREFVAQHVTQVNTYINGAYIFSSGKNMGVFKGVGFPEDIGRFYQLENYSGYSWTAHGRYPTNTPGWWGGAHPFALLDYTIVHNGEISSYDANRRFIEMFGYKCNLLTDTEVITYIMDYLYRKQGLTLDEIAKVVAAPFWSTIEKMPKEQRELHTYLRNAFPGLLITGPFSIIFGFENGIMALNDRLKLRSMVVGEKDDMVYIASEECAIRYIQPELDKLWSPDGGQPVIVTAKEG